MAGDWQASTLGDLLDVKHGFAFQGKFIHDEPRGNVLLTPGNFAIGGGFKEDKFKYYDGPIPDDFVLAEGDLLVTMTDLSKQSDTLGFPAFVPGRQDGRCYLHNQRLGKIQIKDARTIDKRYLHYLLCTPGYRHEVLASATGTTVKHTSPERIRRFRFFRPPVDEQRAIAHIFGTLDDKIELNRRMSETLEAMARALFKSWFVDFDPVRAKAEGRDPGLPGHIADLFSDRLLDSELGEIPEGWHVSQIGDIAQVIDCLHSKKPERTTTGLPLLQLTNIRDDGLLDMKDAYLISEVDYAKWITRIEASPGDCVITNVGRVGAVAQIPPRQKAALGRNMTGVRCNTTFPFPTFILECLLSRAMKEEIVRKTDAGTILHALNVRNIPRLRFVQATDAVMTMFENFARPMRAKMEELIAESRTLTSLRDTLLPKLISGELRVKEAHLLLPESVPC